MQKLLALLDKSAKYLVAAILVIVPLYPKFPFIRIPGAYVAIRAEDFLIAVVGLITLIKLIPKIKNLFKDEIVKAITLFLLVGLGSLISGVILTNTVQFSVSILHLLRRVEYFVPFFFIWAFF